MKTTIRNFALSLGVDDVGFASVDDYRSPNSPPIESLFPGVKSMVVFAFRELSSCDSPSPQMTMSGRLDLIEFSHSSSYRVARFIETNFNTPAMTVPVSYPMNFFSGKPGVADVSLRHAAVAAGLGTFGQHNLVVHPRLGTRVLFTAVLSKLELASDPQLQEKACTGCGLCLRECPAGALEEGKTDLLKCLSHSQPFGIGGSIAFWSRFGEASPEQQKAMLRSPEYRSMYQAGFIGFQYYCFRCLAVCPVGTRASLRK
jgi:epoxyqueuosine reductase QueG